MSISLPDIEAIAALCRAMQERIEPEGLRPAFGVRSVDRCIAACLRNIAASLSAADASACRCAAIFDLMQAFAADRHMPDYAAALREAQATTESRARIVFVNLSQGLCLALERKIEAAFALLTIAAANLIFLEAGSLEVNLQRHFADMLRTHRELRRA